MDPLTAAALIQTGYYGVQSLIDKERSARYANKSRPKYEIPAAATAALNRAVSGAGQYGYAGMGRDIARSEQTMANAMPAMRNLSGSQQMNMLSALVKGTQQQQADIGATAEKSKFAREQQAQQMQMAYAPYEQQKWQWDKQQPYLNAMQTAANFESQSRAGMQAAVGMFSNLVAGEGLGGKKPSTPDPDPVQPMVPKGIDLTQLQPTPGYFDLPTPITRSFAENTLGMPIGDEPYNYYDMGNTYNKIFNNMYRNTWEPDNY